VRWLCRPFSPVPASPLLLVSKHCSSLPDRPPSAQYGLLAQGKWRSSLSFFRAVSLNIGEGVANLPLGSTRWGAHGSLLLSVLILVSRSGAGAVWGLLKRGSSAVFRATPWPPSVSSHSPLKELNTGRLSEGSLLVLAVPASPPHGSARRLPRAARSFSQVIRLRDGGGDIEVPLVLACDDPRPFGHFLPRPPGEGTNFRPNCWARYRTQHPRWSSRGSLVRSSPLHCWRIFQTIPSPSSGC